ncbi:septation protein SepH [Leucobacter chironomi]|uniref:septation protein SepH n=1 Tax=Leucobacter chironomi TaxID=491918 RepID=UPI00041EDF96|nr:septation protein SepH [Leucobacter chironomi]
MDELRLVRREERSLIVANDAGEEFRLVVDDAVLSEMRHLGRRERDTSRVRPREIQALIRAGKTRSQVAQLTGLDEADIERYEEPVIAERNYVLERAHAVPVRTGSDDDGDQRFGAVIAERLIGLGCDTSEWSSWRDPETGWMVALEFISHDVAHRAVWTFEHRKGLLSPVNPDAVNLSKQGDVGDRLIPKLRAVDATEASPRFDSGAFHESSEADPAADGGGDPSGDAADPAPTSELTAPLSDANAEYQRRREIDQRAIKSETADSDLSQTADLLDALRKRRGERDRSRSAAEAPLELPAPVQPAAQPVPPAPPADPDPAPAPPRSIWGAVAGAASAPERTVAQDEPTRKDEPARKADSSRKGESSEGERGGRKGRASIPSWDDILFGTRSDEDPA